VPGGYRPELAAETPLERTRRAVEGLQGYIDGFEYYYPAALNEANVEDISEAIDGQGVYILANALHTDPRFARGGLSSPERDTRRAALEQTLACVDLAGQLGAHVIVWPGNEGYNYPFQIRYAEAWKLLIDALGETAARCQEHGVQLLLEPKSSEPAMNVLMRNVGTTLHVIHRLRGQGLDNVKANLDWQNVFVSHEELAESAALLEHEEALGHQHASSGWGVHDDKTVVGALRFMETLELAFELRESSYAAAGGRLGFDLYPYTEDDLGAVRRSVEQWRAIERIAARIDAAALDDARHTRDALRAQELVYAALDPGTEASRAPGPAGAPERS